MRPKGLGPPLSGNAPEIRQISPYARSVRPVKKRRVAKGAGNRIELPPTDSVRSFRLRRLSGCFLGRYGICKLLAEEHSSRPGGTTGRQYMTSMQEILVIIVIGLLLFNWRKLPDIAGSFGKALTSFKRGLSEPDEVDVNARKDATDAKDLKDQDKNSGETPPKA